MTAPVLHLRGTVLPSGEPTELWLADGVVHTEPVSGAETVHTGGWIVPGLVDAHCHFGLGSGGAVDDDTTLTQAITDRNAGTLLVRDAGSPSDTRWVQDRDDLPRLIRAGRHIARTRRYIRNFADEVEPEDLVATVEKQALAGDGWVKLVGDWIDREVGDLAPSWPSEVTAEAIARAHELGAKVTAHCFAEQSVAELVRAGIDGIEHGTGLDDDTIALMAERQVALVPTMINLDTFPEIAAAGEEKFPTYAAHMRDLHRRRHATLRAAVDAGVPVYAGTDAGGTIEHGRIADEIVALAELAGAEFALGAASWRAREWLGMPGIEPGESADLICYDADPRIDPAVTAHPARVILRGRVVA
ncbi:amidohydrolase family protein [Enemella sp. A6]|uniref:amidohydrolase family protein n=1 Tax=Enemella sp. A6 TaxID=3440152 RepID=UPI003EBC65CA